MSKIPAPVLPQPGAAGASQASNVVQKSVAPQKAPVPQLFSLAGMGQNPATPTPTSTLATPQAQPANPNMSLFGYQYRLPQNYS